jgi:predicted P-loop ATPase
MDIEEWKRVADAAKKHRAQRQSKASPSPSPGTAPKKKQGTKPPNLLSLVTHIKVTPVWNGALRFNLFTENYEVCPPFPPQSGPKELSRPLADPLDVLRATMYFQANGFPKANKAVVFDALATVAHENSYHPVRDYLNSLQWDRTSRVSRLFQHYFKAKLPDDGDQTELDHHVSYLEHTSTSFMVSAVARVMRPGCQSDHVPVVVSHSQGMQKSTAIRKLCPDESWFTDNISADLIDRDTKESLRGMWLIELSEVPHLRRETERVKVFFSTRVDRYRAAYGRATQNHPRQCVFFGSSNDLEFVDPTGNRRFWPFLNDGLIDTAAIEHDRDQLWAEAVELYRQGVRWWLAPNIEKLAAEQQDAFAEDDIWDTLIEKWLATHPGPFTMADLFATDTGITPYREVAAVTRADEMRAGRALKRMKFISSRKRINGVRAHWWESR